jgi:hypothetical protein
MQVIDCTGVGLEQVFSSTVGIAEVMGSWVQLPPSPFILFWLTTALN